jgi:hypothetical protein
VQPSPSNAVLRRLAAQQPTEVFTTAVTPAEILYGVEALPAGKRMARLPAAVEQTFAEEFERPLP